MASAVDLSYGTPRYSRFSCSTVLWPPVKSRVRAGSTAGEAMGFLEATKALLLVQQASESDIPVRPGLHVDLLRENLAAST